MGKLSRKMDELKYELKYTRMSDKFKRPYEIHITQLVTPTGNFLYFRNEEKFVKATFFYEFVKKNEK